MKFYFVTESHYSSHFHPTVEKKKIFAKIEDKKYVDLLPNDTPKSSLVSKAERKGKFKKTFWRRVIY